MTTKPDNELRIRQLEQQVSDLRAIVNALRLTNPNGQIDQIIRPARTCIPRANDSGSEITITPGYPEAGSVVPIKFLDVDHGGLNTNVTKTERSASQQALAATLDGTLPDVDTDGIVFRYGTKHYFLSGSMSASSSVFACDNVFTFYEYDFTPADDCFLMRRRFVSLTVVNNCLDESKTDWEVVGRVMSCDASFSESSETPTECPDCLEFVWAYDNPDSRYITGTSGPRVRITVSSVDLEADWCHDVERRFTVLFENISVDSPNPNDERFHFRGIGTTETCDAQSPWVRVGIKMTPRNTISSTVVLTDCQYPIQVFRGGNFIPVTTFPFEMYVYETLVVDMPCEILERGDSASFWIDMVPRENPGSPDNPLAVDMIFGIWRYTGLSLPDVFGPNIGYSCYAAPIGRCCKDGVCSVTTEATCTGMGGTWAGPGTDCTGPPCPT